MRQGTHGGFDNRDASLSRFAVKAGYPESPAKLYRFREGKRETLSLLFRVSWTDQNGGAELAEETLTEALNSNGARIRLKAHIETGQEIEIENLFNREHARARVVWIGEGATHSGYPVGIKFLTADARSWCAEFAA